MSVWEAEYQVTVRMTVNDEEILERCNTPSWKETIYDFGGDLEDARNGGAEMIMFNCGVKDSILADLDGWADTDKHAVVVNSDIELLHMHEVSS